MVLATTPVRAAEPPAVDGWIVTRASEMSCVASAPSEGGAGVSLASEGPLFTLVVSAPEFPKAKAGYAAQIAFDGRAPVSVPALGDGGVMVVSLSRSDSAKALARASRVTVTIKGHAHTFALRNAGAALDAVARCAGVPTLAEQDETPPQPIAGGGRWMLSTSMPGVAGRACSARVAGDQIDTILLRNNDGQMVLIGGHSDWATWGGDVPLQLSIDGGAATRLTASTANNLIAVLVKDPGLEQRLRSAHSLEWTIPTGRVRGDVTGLGAAFDAVVACATGAPARR